MTAHLSLLVAVVGLVVYGLANGKASEAVRIAYFSGLIVWLYTVSSHAVSILR